MLNYSVAELRLYYFFSRYYLSFNVFEPPFNDFECAFNVFEPSFDVSERRFDKGQWILLCGLHLSLTKFCSFCGVFIMDFYRSMLAKCCQK